MGSWSPKMLAHVDFLDESITALDARIEGTVVG